jgi:hypothetical protein
MKIPYEAHPQRAGYLIRIVDETAPSDPQKYRWGESAERNGRWLTASVYSLRRGWYHITMRVHSLLGHQKLKGAVTFHLHDSFEPPARTVTAHGGEATLKVVAYGAFTVGVEADAGRTKLELDLGDIRDAPKGFKNG